MSVLVGLIVAAAALVLLALHGGSAAALLDPYAALLILGAVCGSFCVLCPFSVWPGVFSALGRSLRPARGEDRLMREVESLAETARRGGVLGLEGREEQVSDPLLRKGLGLLLESAEPEAVRSVLTQDAAALEGRERTAREVLEKLAVFAPGVGMVGTLVEIVQMLARFKNAAQFAPLIAHALLPVVYGAAAAYLLLLPLAARMDATSARRRELRGMAVEGVLAIQAGEPPSLIRERLSHRLRPAGGTLKRKGARTSV